VIGIIGPSDSAELAVSIAEEEGLAAQVVARAYRSVDEAPGLALELDQICQVLLFTGRVPYALGRRAHNLRAELRFVPHSGADLYRTLVLLLLREFEGRLPRASLDTIEASIVREAYEDLGLEPPVHILSLEIAGDEDNIRNAEDIFDFHVARFRAGEVDVCMTCVGSVYERLRDAGVPTWRITHTKSAMREALRLAQLVARLAITEATQPAVVLINVPGLRIGSTDDGGPYEVQRRRLRSREAVLDLAERLQGRLADIDDETFIVYTNRGTIEGAVSRLMAGQGGPLELGRLMSDMRVGVGLGSTVPEAEENARLALVMGDRRGDLHVAFAGGEVFRASRERPPTTYRLRETHEPTLRLARELGLGPLALTRLTRALRQLDASALTATELARAYGIEARSARRLITSLRRAGIATPLGRQGGPRAGRPQTVYRIDLSRLAPLD